MNTFKILLFFEKGNRTQFTYSKEEQKAYLSSLGEAEDDIDRGYKQYLCQNFFVPKWKILFLNFLFLPIPFLLLIFFLLKGIRVRKQKELEAIASLKIERGFFSTSVLEEFNVDDSHWREGLSLQLNDMSFCFRILSKWVRSPFFVSKCIAGIAGYSNMIHKYSPKALLSHCEFSCTSSVLTAYCNSKGVEHINTMHGEKLFFIRDSFFHFDRCYVWDDHYKKIFISMQAEPSQFRVFIPSSLKIDCDKFLKKNRYAEYKYYLQICDEVELKKIISILKSIETSGKSFKLRPHPRYSDMKLLHRLLDEAHIENPSDVSIEESISNSKYVIGSFTTVLNQAYYSGRRVVLDDMTFKVQYDKLKEIGYIMTQKKTIKLSELVKVEK